MEKETNFLLFFCVKCLLGTKAKVKKLKKIVCREKTMPQKTHKKGKSL